MNNIPLSTLKTSIGKKFFMALSGVILFGFVVGHLLGNLQIFLGPEKINAYAHFLKANPGPLWTARLFLLFMLVIHVWTAFQLTLENKRARPQAYVHSDTVQATYASRTMPLTGLIVLAYLIYHLLHFTAGKTHPEHFQMLDAQGRHDVFSMMVLGFQSPLVSGFYILANLFLAFHLSHGLSSLVQTFGFNVPKLMPMIKFLSAVVAWFLFIGYASIPLSVWWGWVTLPPGIVPS